MAASRRRVDPDAADYFARIVAAGSSISEPNKVAVNAFVAGCKVDGIWAAIKASCLLAGPDDLTGALVPLVGAAPTNNGPFVSGDHNRTTGLVGNGSTKYLNSNRNNNADPQDSRHLCVWRTTSESRDATRNTIGTSGSGGSSSLLTTATARFFRSSDLSSGVSDTTTVTGLWGVSRSGATAKAGRYAGVSSLFSDASTTPLDQLVHVFARNGVNHSNARLSFYSIGESLDLALLDARLATYMSALT
jgi:hypothetical protein